MIFKRFARRATGSSKIEPPSLRTNSICFFADTNRAAFEAPLDLGISGMCALHIEHRTLRSSSRSTFDSENRSNPMRRTPSHQAPPSTLSLRRSTRPDPDGSGTTTSIRRSDELLPFTHQMKSMPTFPLSWMPPNLVRRLGTSTYLMSPFEAGYEDEQHWRRAVKFRRDVYTDEQEEIEKTDSPASDPFHPDPLDHRFLSMESNAYQHHFDIPFFEYLTPIHDDFKAAHRRKVSCRGQVLEAVIVDKASSLVTAEAVRFALQSSLAHGQYVHQHLGRLQEEGSRTDMLEIVDRYALGPEVDDISAVIVVRRLSIADTPWWRVDTRTGQLDHSMAAGTGSKETYRWTTGRHDGCSFEATNRTDLWREDVWKPSSLWDFYSTRAQTLGPGHFRALAREHVFVFQYKCPVDDRPGDPNLRLLNHRSGILIQKRALDSDIRRHYTGHDTFKFMAGVETLKEVHEVCRLPVDRSFTFTWGTDC